MKFLRSKGIIVLIIFMTITGVIAAAVSIKISITMIEKRNQMVKNDADEGAVIKSDGKTVKFNGADDLTFYFNGEKVNGINGYITKDGKVLVPMDVILKKAGKDFKYFNSDNMVKAWIGNKTVLIKPGQDNVIINGLKHNLYEASSVAKNHILVSEDMFSYLDGFSVEENLDMKALFINYYPAFDRNRYEKIRVLRLQDETVSISNIWEKKFFVLNSKSYIDIDEFGFTQEDSSFIFKSADNLYLLDKNNREKPRILDVNPSAQYSADSRYLHWVDESKKISYVYDIEKGILKKIGDYYFRINEDNEERQSKAKYPLLYDFRLGNRYKSIAFTGSSTQNCYVFIERRGKLVVDNVAEYSPDRRKVLYYKKGKGWHVVNFDGTGMVFLGDGKQAEWINNTTILLKSEDGDYLVNVNNKKKSKTDSECRKVGQIPGGDVFFTKGNMLYVENKGVEKKIIDLPWKCNYVDALSGAGPYVAVSEKEDGIFFITGNNVFKAGKSSYQFVSQIIDGKSFIKYDDNFSISPDNEKLVVLQQEDGFARVNYIRTNGSEGSITLNYPVNGQVQSGSLKLKWISNNSLLIYTSSCGWIIDFENNISIYNWVEQEGSIIQHIFP